MFQRLNSRASLLVSGNSLAKAGQMEEDGGPEPPSAFLSPETILNGPDHVLRSSGHVPGQTTSDSPLLSQVTQSAVKPPRDQNQELVQRQEPLLEGYPSGFSLIPMERGWNPGHREYCRG